MYSPLTAAPNGRRFALFAAISGRIAAWRKDDNASATWHIAPRMAAAAIVALDALLIRPWLLPLGHGLPDSIFFPSLLMIPLICLIAPGIFGAGLAGLTAVYLLVVPAQHGGIEAGRVLSVLPILLSALALSLSARGLLLARGRLKALAADQQAILDCQVVGIVRVRDRTILWANRGAELLLGWGQGELAGLSTRAMYPDDPSYQSYGSLLQGAEAQGKPVSWELELRRKDGGRIWVDLNGMWQEHSPGTMVTVITDISSRKATEAALRASQAMLARTSTIAGVGGWQYDAGREQLTWLDETCRLHDMPLGHRPTLAEALSYCDPSMRTALASAFDRGMAEGQPWDMELPLITAQGRTKRMRMVGEAEFSDGAVVRLNGVYQDITASDAMRRDLEKTHELGRVTLESIRDAVITVDTDHFIQWLNPAAEALTEHSLASAAGRPLRDVLNMAEEESGALVELPEPDQALQLTTRGGVQRGIEGSASPILDAAGRQAGLVLAFRDVTEQRRLAQVAQQRDKQLADANARMVALFRNSADAMLVARLTVDGRFVYEMVNPVWQQVTGVKEADAIGKTPHDCLPPEVARIVLAGWERCVREREPVFYEFQTDICGPQKWEAAAAPVIEPDGSAGGPAGGRIERLIAVVRDATRRHYLEESMRQMQRMDAVGRLTAGVAHDFNNLLQAILGSLDLLVGNESLDSEALECVAMADSAAERGATLVHRLLAFSRKQSLDPVMLRADAVFADLGVLLSSTLGRRIQVVIEVDPDTWPIRADSVQLENCLFNLAINARDAMPEGGRLTLRADNADADASQRAGLPAGGPMGGSAGGYVRFSVTDTGTGMTDEVRDHALEPFFTTKAIGKGTGLGLSMVQGFARQSGGDMRIVSAVGEGTSVTLWLPSAEAEAAAGAEEPAAADPVRPGRPYVLVVDDDNSVCRMLALLLTKAGMEPVLRENGELALAYLRNGGACDLLVTDQSMPGLAGNEVIEQASLLRPSLPTMLITGHDLVSGLDTLRGRVTVLRKPFRQTVFVAQVRALLGQLGGEAMQQHPPGLWWPAGAMPDTNTDKPDDDGVLLRH